MTKKPPEKIDDLEQVFQMLLEEIRAISRVQQVRREQERANREGKR